MPRCNSPVPAAAALEPWVLAPGPLVDLLPSSPADESNRLYTLWLNAIDIAQRNIWIHMAYFAPNDDLVDALKEAARRGVDVRLPLPSDNDFSCVLHAGPNRYDELLASGVGIWEPGGSMPHAKTVVIDGVLSPVGPSNLDWRSLTLNHAIGAAIFSETFAHRMQAMPRRDIEVRTGHHAIRACSD